MTEEPAAEQRQGKPGYAAEKTREAERCYPASQAGGCGTRSGVPRAGLNLPCERRLGQAQGFEEGLQ